MKFGIASEINTKLPVYNDSTLISTNTARLIYRSRAPIRTVLHIFEWDSAQDDLLKRTVLQDEDLLPNDNTISAKVSSEVRSRSTQSSLINPFFSSKGGCRKKSTGISGYQCLPTNQLRATALSSSS